MVFLYHALSLKILSFLIPLSMYLFPLVFRVAGQQSGRNRATVRPCDRATEIVRQSDRATVRRCDSQIKEKSIPYKDCRSVALSHCRTNVCRSVALSHCRTNVGRSVALFLLLCCSIFVYPSAGRVLYQFFGVALPEEFYFRGFLQDELGNNLRAVIFVSILFSFMHLPRLIFYSDLLSMMTFFPSLIMGYLYLKTGNILASTVFHFLANTAFYLLGYRL
jgi:hypothetical protein